MAGGQATLLQLINSTLRRLGKSQIASADFAGLVADSWGGIVRDMLNEALGEISKEHDWSTLYDSGTFTTSLRTYDLSATFSDFGREIDLVDTTNSRVLEPVNVRDIDEADPGLDDAGPPVAYSIQYPDLLFDRTPSAVAFRLRYIKRPTALAAVGDLSTLPEYCDLPLVLWSYWQLQATREDSADGGVEARRLYEASLARAIGQDRRRMDRTWVLNAVFPGGRGAMVPWPSSYDW